MDLFGLVWYSTFEWFQYHKNVWNYIILSRKTLYFLNRDVATIGSDMFALLLFAQ